MAGKWSNVGEDAARMREVLAGSDGFGKEDSGVVTNDGAGISEFMITGPDGTRYSVTVRDIGD